LANWGTNWGANNWGANWGLGATALPYATAAPLANWGTNWGATGFNNFGFGGLNAGVVAPAAVTAN